MVLYIRSRFRGIFIYPSLTMGLIVADPVIFSFNTTPIVNSYWRISGQIGLVKQSSGLYRASFYFYGYYSYEMRDRTDIQQRVVEFELTAEQLPNLFTLAYNALKTQFQNYTDA